MMLHLNFGSIIPQLILLLLFLVQLIVDAFSKNKGSKAYIGYMSLSVYVLIMVISIVSWGVKEVGFNGMVIYDSFSQFFNLLFAIIASLIILIAPKYMDDQGRDRGEFYSLLTASFLGMSLMVATTNLMIFLISLEIMSLSVYVLAGFEKEKARSTEAAFKYFILGGLASGILLFGIALVYASSGSVDVSKIGAIGNFKFLSILGFVFILTGFLFKIAAVPFHMWTPDTYEGAPTPITAYMAVGVKAAAFAGLIRIMVISLHSFNEYIAVIIWIIAILTMFTGNILAVVQTNLKRMLAYSSIAHAGYMLLGILAYKYNGLSAVLYYLVVYALADIGAFSILIALGKDGKAVETFDDIKGKGVQRPLLGAAMLIFMFSLAGIPPFAGFIGKFFLFKSAIDAGYIYLAVLGILTSVFAVYYYLKVLVYMYMYQSEEKVKYPVNTSVAIGLSIMTFGILLLGILPSRYIDIAMSAIKYIF